MSSNNTYRGNGPKRGKVKRSRLRSFVKSLAILSLIVIALAVGGAGLWRHTVVPPEQPPIYEIFPEHAQPVRPREPYRAPAFIENPEPDPADEDILDALPPFIETDWERRPRFFTFLIFGLDEGANTDTIMVAGFDEIAGNGYVISIPRDTRVDVQRRVRKINAAYPAGRLHGGGHSGGVEQLKREVQTLIGFRPDFYVMLEMDVVVDIIDTIGGVEINVPFHMRYTQDTCQDLYIDIPAGVQVLDGESAMNFARFRYADPGFRSVTDFTRMRHQQQLLSTLFRSMIRPANILLIPDLVRLGDEMLTTDLELRHLAWFGQQLALATSPYALETYTLPIRGNTGRAPWYEYPDPQGILELVNRTINPFTTDITLDMLRIAP